VEGRHVIGAALEDAGGGEGGGRFIGQIYERALAGAGGWSPAQIFRRPATGLRGPGVSVAAWDRKPRGPR
jgi:hypothetical protein